VLTSANGEWHCCRVLCEGFFLLVSLCRSLVVKHFV